MLHTLTILLPLLASSASQPASQPASRPSAAKPCLCEQKPGIWFPTQDALRLSNELKTCRKELPTLREMTKKLEVLVYNTHPRRTASLTAEIAIVNKKVELLTGENDRLAHALKKAQARQTAWWRSPILWFCAGLVVSGAGAVTIAVATR
jgi:hypothetical protein